MNSGDDILTILGEDILCEILSRCPVKFLLQFKRVSKRWLSLIQSPYFVELQSTRSRTRRPDLLITVYEKQAQGLRFYTTEDDDLFEGGEAIPRTTTSWKYTTLKSVNGLICVLDYKESAVCIYNISTKKISPWIKTTINREEEREAGYDILPFPVFGFGFNPASKEHKVICLWMVRGLDKCSVCEVLTIGKDKTWRRMEEVQPYIVLGAGKGVYVNGSIYWWDSDSPVIVAFDVGSEQFRVIPIPDFCLNIPRRSPCGLFTGRFDNLLEVDGCIALLDRTCTYYSAGVKLWIFDDKNKNTIISPSSSSNRNNNWIEEMISLPFFGREPIFSYHAIAGTDHIILKSLYLKEKTILEGYLSLYCYDRKKKTSKKVIIRAISPSMNSRGNYDIETFMESLLPVQ